MKSVTAKKILIPTILAINSGAYATPVGLSVGASSLGAHAAVVYDSTESLNVRVGVNSYDHELDIEIDAINYESELELKSLFGVIDWFPWANNFRLTAGIFSNSTQLSGFVNSNENSIVFNGKEINVSDAGAINYQVGFDPLVPYLGVGWGNVARGGGFSAFVDIGVLFQGSADIELTVENAQAVGLSQDDINAEIDEFEEEADPYAIYPVVTVGFGLNL